MRALLSTAPALAAMLFLLVLVRIAAQVAQVVGS